MTQDEYFLLFLFIGIMGLIIGWYSTTGYKSQGIRILDVVAFGPLLIAASFCHNWFISILLVLVGTATMSYNLKNYFVQTDI